MSLRRKRKNRCQSTPLSERLVKRLQSLGVKFELDSINYVIVRLDDAILANAREGMDYAIWWLADISYGTPVTPMIWSDDLDKMVATTVDSYVPVTKLVRRDHPLEVHRGYGRCSVD